MSASTQTRRASTPSTAKVETRASIRPHRSLGRPGTREWDRRRAWLPPDGRRGPRRGEPHRRSVRRAGKSAAGRRVGPPGCGTPGRWAAWAARARRGAGAARARRGAWAARARRGGWVARAGEAGWAFREARRESWGRDGERWRRVQWWRGGERRRRQDAPWREGKRRRRDSPWREGK